MSDIWVGIYVCFPVLVLMKEYLWNRTGSLCLFCAQMHDVFMFMYLSQYRTTEMPSFKYYVSCATFIFLCIFIIQMCVTQQWVIETHTHTHARGQNWIYDPIIMIYMMQIIVLLCFFLSDLRSWGWCLRCWRVCYSWPLPSVLPVTFRLLTAGTCRF